MTNDRALAVGATTFTLSVLAWLAWLGFHAEYDTDPVTGSTTGPYEPGQVVGLVLTLVVVLFVAAWLGPPVPAALGAVAGLGFIASVDWATAPDADGLWVIGVGLLMVGAAAGASAVAFVARWVRPVSTR